MALDAGDRAVYFIERFCTHVKGELGGKPLLLADWQKDFIRQIFGTLRPDGLRQYRTTLLAIPRKNAKSTLSAAIALYLLLADGEPGAEIFSCGGDRAQASIVFDIARGMVAQNERLSKLCKVYRNSITMPSTHSFYKALSSESYTKHGLSPHGIIFDELHTQPDAELWRVMTSATGARRQPLTAALTTAGSNKQSICYQVWKYAEQVRDGIVVDPEFFPMLYSAAPEDDWTDPAVWAKANPGLGISVKLDDLKTSCARAIQMQTEESSFRMLRLNQWVNSEQAWLRQIDFEACSSPLREGLEKLPCYCGLDLSATFDTTSFVAFWPHPDGTYDVYPVIWIPEDNVQQMMQRDKVPYDLWIRQGAIRTTPGKTTDYATVEKFVLEFSKQFQIHTLAVDRWQAEMISQKFVGEGINCLKFGQGYGSLSAPSKLLEGFVASRTLRHAGQPALAWQASNVTVVQDSAGNIKPCKAKSNGRIDAIAALVNAIGAYAAGLEKEAELNWDILAL